MDDLISRQAAIEVADAVWMVTGDNNVAKVWAQLKDIPSAQKKGHWMPIIEANENGEPYQSGVFCNQCGHEYVTEHNFCPNCGADMREEGDANG